MCLLIPIFMAKKKREERKAAEANGRAPRLSEPRGEEQTYAPRANDTGTFEPVTQT